jgi:hypothetical protein
MITTILIVLVAVVVLIVIIAVLALHFLRADDSDSFDEMAEESRGSRRSPAEQAPAADRRRSRRDEPDHESWPAERSLRAVDDRAARASADRPARPADRALRAVDDRPVGYRDLDTGPRQTVPERRGGQAGGQRPAAARSPKPAKAASADASTAAWDSMSDVDYWAELAADKPRVAPAPAALPAARQNGAARRGHDAPPAADARGARRGDSGPMPAGTRAAAQLPVRSRRQAPMAPAASAGRSADVGQTEQFDARPARTYANEPTTQSLAALARLSGPHPASAGAAGGQRPSGSARSAPGARGSGNRPGTGPRAAQAPIPASQLPQSGGYAGRPGPADDDPLTSPSFPAINTSDSRSYRTRRPGGGPSGPHTGPQYTTGPMPAQSPAAQAPIAPSQIPQSAPVANPYGSYVSAPQPTYQDTAAAHQDAALYNRGYANGQQSTSGQHSTGGSWYGEAASGYLTPGYNGNGNGHAGSPSGNGHASNGNGHPSNGSSGTDYQHLSYQNAEHQVGSAAPGYASPGPFADHHDQRGYGTPDLGYSQDGYQGYPGYGAAGR